MLLGTYPDAASTGDLVELLFWALCE